MEIYLTRHGQTLWNKEGRIQGYLDSPLTSEGIDDAKKLSNRLKDEQIDACFTSKQDRAVHTGQIIMQDQDGILIKTDDLKELGVGAWQGMLYEDIKRDYSDDFNLYISRADLYKPKNGGEDYRVLETRVKNFLDELKSLPHKKIVIVTHGVTHMMLLNLMEDKSLRDLCFRSVPRGLALSKVKYENGLYNILYENDERHLEE